MILTIILALASMTCTGLIYYFAGMYHHWAWIFAIIPMVVVFYLAAFATYLIVLYVGSIIVGRGDPNKIHKPNRFAMWVISQTAGQILFIMRCRVHFTGKGKLPDKTPFILMHNHLSIFDEFALASKFKNKMVYISKPGNLRIPIAGPWMRYAGFVAISQEDMTSAAQVIEDCSQRVYKEHLSFCVAPEGTRNKEFPNPVMLPFHNGTFRLAVNCGAPIVLCAIQNTLAVIHRFPRRTHIYLDIVGVITKEEYDGMSLPELANKCRSMILARLEKKDARFYHLDPKDKDPDIGPSEK